MPGTQQPDAARYERFKEPTFQESFVKDADGSILVPCLAHGDYVKVKSLQTDHMQAKENIMYRQKQLVELLNRDAKFAEFVMSLEGMNKFFIKVKMKDDEEPKYYGTVFFYELYFNDIDNLWLICQACNLHKGKIDTLDWLQKQWSFGKEFLDYLHKQSTKDKGILKKVEDEKGLAEVAIEWFWDRHASYIANAKELLKDTIIPIKILNQTLDHLYGSGRLQEAKELEIGIEFRQKLAHKVATMEGIDLPNAAKVIHKAPLEVRDEKGKEITLKPEDVKKSMNKVANVMPHLVKTQLEEQALADTTKRKEHTSPQESKIAYKKH